jgi:p-aminobenzoyl-glutamate transporter AbgT
MNYDENARLDEARLDEARLDAEKALLAAKKDAEKAAEKDAEKQEIIDILSELAVYNYIFLLCIFCGAVYVSIVEPIVASTVKFKIIFVVIVTLIFGIGIKDFNELKDAVQKMLSKRGC